MSKRFSMRTQMQVGQSGFKELMRLCQKRFGTFRDYSADQKKQRMGVDCWLPGYGYVEVKTDTHKSGNFFMEYVCANKPSGIMTSQAKWWAIYLVNLGLVYFLYVPGVRRWIKQNLGWLEQRYKRTIWSEEAEHAWSAFGLVIPRDFLILPGKAVIYRVEDDELVLIAGREPIRRRRNVNRVSGRDDEGQADDVADDGDGGDESGGGEGGQEA